MFVYTCNVLIGAPIVPLRGFFYFQPSVRGLVVYQWASGAMSTVMPQTQTARMICATVSEAPASCTTTECSSVPTLFQHYQAVNKCNLYWLQLKTKSWVLWTNNIFYHKYLCVTQWKCASALPFIMLSWCISSFHNTFMHYSYIHNAFLVHQPSFSECLPSASSLPFW